jgi:hypothetical protein
LSVAALQEAVPFPTSTLIDVSPGAVGAVPSNVITAGG